MIATIAFVLASQLGPNARAEMNPDTLLRDLGVELQLTEQQAPAVSKIAEDARVQLDALRLRRKEIHPTMGQPINTVLMPEQAQTFERLPLDRHA